MRLRSLLHIAFAAVILAGQSGSIELAAQETPASSFVTGAKFQKALGQPFPASWTFADLRQITRDVSEDRQISIVLDRRLDPSRRFPFESKSSSLKTGLEDLATANQAHVCLLRNAVYLGPLSATRRLRTLVELRTQDIQSKEAAFPERRRSELQRHRNFAWSDLQTPREILDGMTSPFRLKIANIDLVSHDLWAGAALPDMTLVEALSVVLIQFDLTFRSTDSGSAIELIPIPEQLFLERKHHSKMKAADALSLIHQKLPDLDAKVSQADVVVRGLAEDHEAVASLLRGESPPQQAKGVEQHPIRQRVFTLSLEQPVPLIALMKKLEETDIHFEYNADDLKAAGIDLEQMIKVDVKNSSATDFFKKVFDPASLDFQIDRQTVKLKPKRSALTNQ